MPQMEGGGPSERYRLSIEHFGHSLLPLPRPVILLLIQNHFKINTQRFYAFVLRASYAGNQMPWVVVEVRLLPVPHPPAVDLIRPWPWCASRPAVDGSFP